MTTSPTNTPTDRSMVAAGDKQLEESSLGNPYYLSTNIQPERPKQSDDPNSPIPDFYGILSVAPTCTHAEIDAAYRVLASANHPSRSHTDRVQAQRKFNEIGHAYSVLSDSARRYYYDQLTQHHFSKEDAIRNFEAFFREFDLEPEQKQFFAKHYPKKEPNFYEVLGVSKDATHRQIEDAFRKKAVQLHPNNSVGDQDAEKKFMKLCQAYSLLIDDERRHCYDMTLGGHQIPSEVAFEQFNQKFDGAKFDKVEDEKTLGGLVKKASLKRDKEVAKLGLKPPAKVAQKPHPSLISDNPQIVIPGSNLPETPRHLTEFQETQKKEEGPTPATTPAQDNASTITNKPKEKPAEPVLHHDIHKPLQYRYKPEGWPAYAYDYNHPDDKYNYHNYQQDILHETVTHKTPNGPVTKKTQNKTSQINGRQVREKIESVTHPDGREDVTHTVDDHNGATTQKWSVKDGKRVNEIPESHH